MSNDTTTPEQEVNQVPEETVNDEQSAEETIGDTLGDTQTEEKQKENKVPDNVPYDRFKKVNEEKNALEERIKELEQGGDSTTPDTEKGPELKEIADKLAKIEEKENIAKRDAVIESGLAKALDEAPEYKKVVNTELVKKMALNPAYKDLTFSQLLDEAYGNALGGKRTVESTTPRGGAKDSKVDLDRAQRDPEYRKEVLRDPGLKKQYNEGLEHRINL